DAAPGVGDRQRLLIEARAAAALALDVDVGQEAHFHLDATLAGAGLAAPALDVEREAASGVAAAARIRRHGEQAADVVEEADVRRRRRARRAADRRLVDLDDALDRFVAAERAHAADPPGGEAELAAQPGVEDIAHQGRLARPGDAGHARPCPDRHLDIDRLQVVLG